MFDIYIEDVIGPLKGYAIIPNEDGSLIKVSVSELPDFPENWEWNGSELVKVKESATLQEALTSTPNLQKQNAMLMKQLAAALKTQTQAQALIAQLTMQVAKLSNSEGATTNE